jgi:hypothetical protein
MKTTDTVPYCLTKYAEAACLALCSGLTLDERERLAYANGDHATRAIILAAEAGNEDYLAELAEDLHEDYLAELAEDLQELASARTIANELRAEVVRLRNLKDAVSRVLSPYTAMRYGRVTSYKTKPAPAWARDLLGVLQRNGLTP